MNLKLILSIGLLLAFAIPIKAVYAKAGVIVKCPCFLTVYKKYKESCYWREKRRGGSEYVCTPGGTYPGHVRKGFVTFKTSYDNPNPWWRAASLCREKYKNINYEGYFEPKCKAVKYE